MLIYIIGMGNLKCRVNNTNTKIQRFGLSVLYSQ